MSINTTRGSHAAALVDYVKSDAGAVAWKLRPVMALREVIAVCEAVRSGHQPPQPQDRRSLLGDVQQALSEMGERLAGSLEPVLGEYRKAVTGLSAMLDSASDTARLLHTSRALVTLLRRPESAHAAWCDLVTAVTEGKPEEVGRLRALQLREIEESLGHEWRWRRSALIQAIEHADADSDAPSPQVLQSAGQVLNDSPDHSAQVAWFMFTNADLGQSYLRIGQIQLFSYRLWSQVTDRTVFDRLPDAEFPAELSPYALRLLRPEKPTPRNSDDVEEKEPVGVVYARVELTGVRAAGRRNPRVHGVEAGAWARDLLLKTVETAVFGVGRSGWRLMDGHIIYHGGTPPEDMWSSAGWFIDPLVVDRINRRREPLRDATGEGLQGLPAGFVDALAEADPAAEDAAAEVRWHQTVRNQSDVAQRAVLHVRSFERVLPRRQGEHWDRAVAYYFRDRWAIDEFTYGLSELAHYCDIIIRRMDPQALPGLEPFVTRTGIAFTVDHEAFLREAGKVADVVPDEHSVIRMRARQAARWAGDPLLARKELEQWQRRFDTLLKRALRQRNAVAHGGRTVPEVVTTVDEFLSQLSAYAVVEARYRVGTGKELGEILQEGRAAHQRRLWELEQEGAATGHVLFAN